MGREVVRVLKWSSSSMSVRDDMVVMMVVVVAVRCRITVCLYLSRDQVLRCGVVVLVVREIMIYIAATMRKIANQSVIGFPAEKAPL